MPCPLAISIARSERRLRRAPGSWDRVSAAFRRAPDVVPLRTRDGQCGRTSPASFVEDVARARSTPPPRASGFGKGNLEDPVKEQDVLLPAEAHRTAATHVLEPVAGRAVFEPKLNPGFEKRSPNASRSWSDRAHDDAGQFGRLRPRAATRARSRRRITSNMAANAFFPYARVPMWVTPAKSALLSMGPDEGNCRDQPRPAATTQGQGNAPSCQRTPGSCPKRKARSSSRPGWNMASARSSRPRASTILAGEPMQVNPGGRGERLSASGRPGFASTSLRKAVR